jgi:hypothetical protein
MEGLEDAEVEVAAIAMQSSSMVLMSCTSQKHIVYVVTCIRDYQTFILGKIIENPHFSWISIIFPLPIGSYFKLMYSTPLDQNSSTPILPFLCINQHSLFWNLKLTLIT